MMFALRKIVDSIGMGELIMRVTVELIVLYNE